MVVGWLFGLVGWVRCFLGLVDVTVWLFGACCGVVLVGWFDVVFRVNFKQ